MIPLRSTLPIALLLAVGCAASDSPGGSGDTSASASLADALLTQTMHFHDPQGLWSSGRFQLELEESRPDGTVRQTKVEIGNDDGSFHLVTEHRGEPLEVRFQGDEIVDLLYANMVPAPPDRDDFDLWDEALLRKRNYYLYLYGLPMKLRDPGTLLAPDINEVDFQGRAALELKVTYDPDVGGDTWYFYVDPDTSEMFGYRFYHDEAAGDGEYIVLDGLAAVQGMRLPRSRTWYTHQGDELLGTDTIVGP